MRKIVVIAMLLTVYCLIAGCNCACMSDSSCPLPDSLTTASLESSVSVGVSSETLVR